MNVICRKCAARGIEFASQYAFWAIFRSRAPFRIYAADVTAAAAVHARLIRHHTVAQGYETCDYWYVGDQNTEAQ